MNQIKLLYKELLLRNADDSGLKFYYDKIKNENKTIENIRDYIYESNEYKEIKKIIDLYSKYLYRIRDRNGILNYYHRLKNNDNSFEEIENIIKSSDESKIKNKIINQITSYNIKITNKTLHTIYENYDKKINNPFYIYQKFLNEKIKNINKTDFFYLDPNHNNIGHYNLMKKCISEVFDIKYFQNINELKTQIFNSNTLYIFYVYTIKNEINITNLINFIHNYSKFNIKFYINIWNQEVFELLRELDDLNNVNLICDVNLNYVNIPILYRKL